MILSALGAGGCGNLTMGGIGEVSVDVASDAEEPAPAAGPSARMAVLGPAEPPAPPAQTLELLTGRVEAVLALFLVPEGGNELRLGPETITVSLDLADENGSSVVDRQDIPTGQYTALRIVFTEVRAVVQGLIIDQLPVPEVRVAISGDDLPVTRSLDLDIDEGDHADLLVDLNALTWIEAVDPLTGTVDEAVFADLVDVVVR